MRGQVNVVNASGAIATGRGEDRTHLFLDAILVSASSSLPVRVRNLSPTGALIEGVDLPTVGSQVTLTRGLLEAAGRTMWVGPGRCGLEFDTPLAVSRWLPNKNTPRQPAKTNIRSISSDPSNQPEHGRSSGEVFSEAESPCAKQAIADLVPLQYELATLRDHVACDARLSRLRDVSILQDAAERIERIVAMLRHG